MIVPEPAQCASLARRLDRLTVRPDAFVVQAATPAERRREADLWFFLVGICQSTRTLQGTIEGVWRRGWDYMVAAARRALVRDAQSFTAERLCTITPDALRVLFSDSGAPEDSTLDRIDERVAQLQDASALLIRRYEGTAVRLAESAGGVLRGPEGILARLAECDAYSDPVEKKSFLLVMFCVRSGAWQVRDLDALKVAIDYHIMRVALRSGMVSVRDATLAERLRGRSPVTAEEDNVVRSAVRDACDLLVRESHKSVFDVDNILWMIGRNCCFYDHDPICGPAARGAAVCGRRDACTLLRGIATDCPGQCPLDGVCLGSQEPSHRAYWETTLVTRYY